MRRSRVRVPLSAQHKGNEKEDIIPFRFLIFLLRHVYHFFFVTCKQNTNKQNNEFEIYHITYCIYY